MNKKVVFMSKDKKKSFSESRKYSKYKIKNWSEYNDSLRKHGDLDLMIAENIMSVWYQAIDKKKRGGQPIFSDKAIMIVFQIKCLFSLPLRGTQGFVDYLFEKMGLKLKCPDYILHYIVYLRNSFKWPVLS